MKSMTGFGYAESEAEGIHLSVEIKSLNTRYLDLIVSLPSSFSRLEGRVRDCLKQVFTRGHIEVSVRVKDIEKSLSISFDKALAAEWKNALKELADFTGSDQKISLEMLLQQDGLFNIERQHDVEAYWTVLKTLLTSSSDQVLSMRYREGGKLAQDILSQISRIEESLRYVCQRAPEIKAEVEKNLRSRFQNVLGDNSGEQRVMMETAAWIAKMDINEEITRLKTHLATFRKEAEPETAKGKKLDFLAQEMGREINTIGAKTPRADISHCVVDMKNALERIREQLRNVE